LRQFFLDIPADIAADQPPRPGQTVTLARDESHHLNTVLRGGRDQQLHLTDGRGRRYTARAVGGSRREVQLEILTVSEDAGERTPPLLHLACAVVKGRRFEWVLEKSVELGAHRIVPLITEHGVIEPGPGRRERWTGILKAAVKQSGRCLLPELSEPVPLAEHLGGDRALQGLFGAVPGEEPGAVPWSSLMAPVPDPLPAVLEILIGPEGGWTAGERAQLAAAGRRPVQLGPHVLRTETAAVAGLTALQTLRGHWTSS
jgi:16S rRNA (uracil1498-N3)-methyltransferase